ncbi:jun-like transcription factor [Lecanora helva]
MAGKKKVKKPPPEIKPQYVLGENVPLPPPKSKKKKNAPDKPQPAWMFPPDEENPVLNPKPKSEEQRLKDEKAKEQAIKYLRYKSVSAPMKDPPPELLCNLVGGFLTSYGFDSTSRIYTLQLRSRKKLDEWKISLDTKLPNGFPNLVRIFKEWYKVHQERTAMDETSSSSSSDGDNDDDDDDSSRDTKRAKKAKKAKSSKTTKAETSEEVAVEEAAKNETSSSGDSDSDSSSGSKSDLKLKDSTAASKPNVKSKRILKKKSSSPSASSSVSESDADDEQEPAGAKSNQAAPPPGKTIHETKNSLKRKAGSSAETESSDDSSGDEQPASAKKIKSKATKSSPSSSDTSSSSSETSSSESNPNVKPTEKASAPPTANGASSSSDTSDINSLSSDSEGVDFSKPPKPTKTSLKLSPNLELNSTQPASDSSETLQATSTQKPHPTQPGLPLNSTPSDSAEASTTKRKRSSSPTETKSHKNMKKQNTPFQRVPSDTQVDSKLSSNAYRSYDYADRAHQDLSVTKGKGFTKEKNKKKRGTYRGGAIDISGGKGIKFED